MPQTPPPEVPIVSWPTPVIADVLLVDEWNTELAEYKPLEYGTTHPNVREYPNHKLVFQKPSRAERWVQRFWVNDRVNQDTYNYAIEYSGEANAYPIYLRSYVVPRTGYTPIAKGTADPVVAAAKLVSERVASTTGTPELDSKYIRVNRVYETLPGPLLPFTRYDDNLGPIQGTRQAVVNTGQAAVLTATGKTTYESRDGSSYVSWELKETWSDGTGGAGNPAYPIQTIKGFDPETGAAMITTKQIVTIGSSPTAIGTASGAGSVIDSSILEYNQFLGEKVTVTMALPATRTLYGQEMVGIPARVYSITPLYYCDGSQFFSTRLDYSMDAAGSRLCVLRTVVSYSLTAPAAESPDGYTTRDLRYDGKSYNFNLNNVLNDVISYTGPFYQTSGGVTCTWIESWNFAPTSPSASGFGGNYWPLRKSVDLYKNAFYRITKTSFYAPV